MEYYEQLTFTGKEYQRDKIIEIVKKAIADNTVNGSGEDDIIALDCNDVDHIAEEVAEEVYDLYISVFDNEIESLKRGIKELQSRNADLKRVNEAIQRATAQDILQQMWDWKDRGTPFIADIQELADRYGVEVKNDD